MKKRSSLGRTRRRAAAACAVIASLLAAPPAARAASLYDYYVATTGHDTGSGSASDPFRTIQHAAALAKPSTTIHVAPGTYTGNIDFRTSGTASGRIVFVSDTKKWGAKIVGTGTEAMWTNYGSYVDIVDFDVSGPGRLGIFNMGSNTTIKGNRVHDLAVSGGCTGNGGAGILDGNYDAADDDIIGNEVHDIGIPGSCNGVQGIYHSNLRGHIANNLVYRVSAWGIHLWHAANKVVVANNTTFANGSAGMGGGIVIGAGDSPGGVVLDDTQVINNIVYDNPGIGIDEYCYPGQNCIGSHNTVSNNLVYANGTGIVLRVGTDVATVVANPRFRDYQPEGAGDYRLKKKSPAVDQGTAVSAPSDDFNGVARPRGAGFDIGAYESH